MVGPSHTLALFYRAISRDLALALIVVPPLAQCCASIYFLAAAGAGAEVQDLVCSAPSIAGRQALAVGSVPPHWRASRLLFPALWIDFAPACVPV